LFSNSSNSSGSIGVWFFGVDNSYFSNNQIYMPVWNATGVLLEHNSENNSFLYNNISLSGGGSVGVCVSNYSSNNLFAYNGINVFWF